MNRVTNSLFGNWPAEIPYMVKDNSMYQADGYENFGA